jgi:hypothetical protein
MAIGLRGLAVGPHLAVLMGLMMGVGRADLFTVRESAPCRIVRGLIARASGALDD